MGATPPELLCKYGAMHRSVRANLRVHRFPFPNRDLNRLVVNQNLSTRQRKSVAPKTRNSSGEFGQSIWRSTTGSYHFDCNHRSCLSGQVRMFNSQP